MRAIEDANEPLQQPLKKRLASVINREKRERRAFFRFLGVATGEKGGWEPE
jgi:hypothetical protein